MIDTYFKEFIQHIKNTPALLHETVFAAMMGDHEKYFQSKFGYFLYHKLSLSLDSDKFSLALESFDKNDMVIRAKDAVYFVEWKAMTLPIASQNFDRFKINRINVLSRNRQFKW